MSREKTCQPEIEIVGPNMGTGHCDGSCRSFLLSLSHLPKSVHDITALL